MPIHPFHVHEHFPSLIVDETHQALDETHLPLLLSIMFRSIIKLPETCALCLLTICIFFAQFFMLGYILFWTLIVNGACGGGGMQEL
jgi:hypothetical protein